MDERMLKRGGGAVTGGRETVDFGASRRAAGSELSAGKAVVETLPKVGDRGSLHEKVGRVSNRAKPKSLRRRVPGAVTATAPQDFHLVSPGERNLERIFASSGEFVGQWPFPRATQSSVRAAHRPSFSITSRLLLHV